MATTKAEFQELAEELLTDEFVDFMQSCLFSRPGSYDPLTGTSGAATTETIPCLRVEYKAREIDGQAIQKSDFQLIARVAEFSALSPRTDGVRVAVDGLVCNIVSAEKDPADAIWIIQVRA